MNNEERKHIEEQLREHRRRLSSLEIKCAKKGINSDAEDINEIEDIKNTIKALEEQRCIADAKHVHLITHPDIDPLPNQDCVLNWSKYYPFPTSEQWETILLDLIKCRQKCNQQSGIFLRADAHLSAGIAFGYMFPTTRSIPFWVEQYTNGRPVQVWKSTAHCDDPNLPRVTKHFEPTPETQDRLIEISITQSTKSAVEPWFTDDKKPFRCRIVIEPEDGPDDTFIKNGSHAVHIAHFIRKQITNKRIPNANTHIVGSFPVGLAVFIGRHLNACGSIQCYEYVKGENIYTATFSLTPQ